MTIRISEDELARWQAQASAAGLSLADLVRERMENRTVGKRRRRIQPADPALLALLGRLNSNINQLARWANAHKSKAEAVPMLAALTSIDKFLSSCRPDPAVADADAD